MSSQNLPVEILMIILNYLENIQTLVHAKRASRQMASIVRQIESERRAQGKMEVVRKIGTDAIFDFCIVKDDTLALLHQTSDKISFLINPGADFTEPIPMPVSGGWDRPTVIISFNNRVAVGSSNGIVRILSGKGVCLKRRRNNNAKTRFVLNRSDVSSLHSLCVWNNRIVCGLDNDSIELWAIPRKHYHIVNATDNVYESSDSIHCRLKPIRVRTLTGHSRVINSLVVFNEWLVSGSKDRSIKMWDSDGKCVKTLIGHNDDVRCLVVFAGYLVSGSLDKTLRWWDSDGNCVKVLHGHAEGIKGLASSETLLASECRYNIKIWSLTGECLRTIMHDCVCYHFPILFWHDVLVAREKTGLIMWA